MSDSKDKMKEELARIAGGPAIHFVSCDRLRKLLRRLDPQGVVLSDAGLDVFVEQTPQVGGEIGIGKFVDWLYEDEANVFPDTLPDGGRALELRVYWSNHLTPNVETQRRKWLSELTGFQVDENTMSIKASMPPFNNSNKMPLPNSVLQINVPVYGPNIPNAVMNIFQPDEMKRVADRLCCTIPPYVLSTFVQGKMFKVQEMVAEARKQESLSAHAAAIDKLESFVKAFQALKVDQVKDLAAWTKFVNEHAKEGWEHRLHFDHLLDNFGFDKQASDALRVLEYVYPDGEKVSFEQHAFRWLGKAFAGYGPLGCMTDVVNLVFAMMGIVPAGLQEGEIAQHIDEFRKRVERKDFTNLWIPSHFVMDAESDDTLCWILLEYIHDCKSSKLKTFIQLPTDESLNEIAEQFKTFRDVRVFRDPDAKNLDPVKKNFGIA